MLRFLGSKPARIATILLLLQGGLLYSSLRPEAVPAGQPLALFPNQLGSWKFVQEGIIDKESLAVLNADDLLNRSYQNSAGRPAGLFVAAFRSQRNGKAPHSPKNCLPGSGWTPVLSDEYPVDLGAGRPMIVNRYIVANGNARSLVLYWYQSRDRVVASEYTAKFWVMVDAIRLNRTDTALVRVVVPLDNDGEEDGTRDAVDFVKSFFGTLHEYLPT
jgi:EpsI family protein